jgi:hypothetical protein
MIIITNRGGSIHDRIWSRVQTCVHDRVRNRIWLYIGDHIGSTLWSHVEERVLIRVDDRIVDVGERVEEEGQR